MNPLYHGLRVGLLAASLAFAGCSPMRSMSMSADSATFRTTLSAAAEVPPNASTGMGTLDATFDKSTRTLRWTMNYAGLSGPATMAHFHGPAMAGANAGVAVPIPNAMSPNDGAVTLTPEQAADLVAGKWYVNVHTAAHPGGEIRGQLTSQ